MKKVKPKQNNYFFLTRMYAQPYLQKYKGISTRHTCPECGQKQSFTLYLDGNTNEPIHRTVGKCNRESKCGYHYTPKQYFLDNPSFLSPPLAGGWVGSSSSNTTTVVKRSTPSPLERAGVRSTSLSSNSLYTLSLFHYLYL